MRTGAPEPAAPRRVFFGAAALLFGGGAALTAVCSRSMTAMAGLPLCGQTWRGAAVSFLGMWTAMTAAMMLPSLAPALWRYRQAAARAGARRPDLLAVLAGLGYFSVWTALGAAIFPLDAALSWAGTRLPALARAAPGAAGLVILAAGMLQFSAWKARRLACCRQMPGRRPPPAGAGAALRLGLRLGLDCGACCAGLTAAMLAAGAMNLGAMAAATAAVTAERLAPDGARAARLIGVAAVIAGAMRMAQASGLSPG